MNIRTVLQSKIWLCRFSVADSFFIRQPRRTHVPVFQDVWGQTLLLYGSQGVRRPPSANATHKGSLAGDSRLLHPGLLGLCLTDSSPSVCSSSTSYWGSSPFLSRRKAGLRSQLISKLYNNTCVWCSWHDCLDSSTPWTTQLKNWQRSRTWCCVIGTDWILVRRLSGLLAIRGICPGHLPSPIGFKPLSEEV